MRFILKVPGQAGLSVRSVLPGQEPACLRCLGSFCAQLGDPATHRVSSRAQVLGSWGPGPSLSVGAGAPEWGSKQEGLLCGGGVPELPMWEVPNRSFTASPGPFGMVHLSL